jgi:hypothetical protein
VEPEVAVLTQQTLELLALIQAYRAYPLLEVAVEQKVTDVMELILGQD